MNDRPVDLGDHGTAAPGYAVPGRRGPRGTAEHRHRRASHRTAVRGAATGGSGRVPPVTTARTGGAGAAWAGPRPVWTSPRRYRARDPLSAGPAEAAPRTRSADAQGSTGRPCAVAGSVVRDSAASPDIGRRACEASTTATSAAARTTAVPGKASVSPRPPSKARPAPVPPVVCSAPAPSSWTTTGPSIGGATSTSGPLSTPAARYRGDPSTAPSTLPWTSSDASTAYGGRVSRTPRSPPTRRTGGPRRPPSSPVNSSPERSGSTCPERAGTPAAAVGLTPRHLWPRTRRPRLRRFRLFRGGTGPLQGNLPGDPGVMRVRHRSGVA